MKGLRLSFCVSIWGALLFPLVSGCESTPAPGNGEITEGSTTETSEEQKTPAQGEDDQQQKASRTSLLEEQNWRHPFGVSVPHYQSTVVEPIPCEIHIDEGGDEEVNKRVEVEREKRSNREKSTTVRHMSRVGDKWLRDSETTTVVFYDEQGRTIRTESFVAPQAEDFEVVSEYSEVGDNQLLSRTIVTSFGNVDFVNEFNYEDGIVSELVTRDGSEDSLLSRTEFSYEDDGRRILLRNWRGDELAHTALYQYESDGLLGSKERTWTEGSSTRRVEYEYDDEEKPMRAVVFIGGEVSEVRRWIYDCD